MEIVKMVCTAGGEIAAEVFEQVETRISILEARIAMLEASTTLSVEWTYARGDEAEV